MIFNIRRILFYRRDTYVTERFRWTGSENHPVAYRKCTYFSDIGKETGISRVAVKARIQALEKQGIIEEYTTIINPQKISGAVSCYFEIEIKPDHLSQVTDILHNNDTVTQIYRVTGRDKLHVHAVASSSDEMEHFLHTVIDTLPGVISCSCNTILSRIKDIKGLRL